MNCLLTCLFLLHSLAVGQHESSSLLSPRMRQIRSATFDQISTNEGLSNPDVRTITRDSIGFMWFGTSNGLNRFDGYVMRVYKPIANDPKSISDTDIRSLYVDRLGTLWVGTYAGGLLRYNHHEDTFRRIPQNTDARSRNIGSIYQDRAGVLWLGTEHGLSKYDPRTDEFLNYHYDSGNSNCLSDNTVMHVITDSHGEGVWATTLNGGLNRFQPNKNLWTQFIHDSKNPQSLPSGQLSVLREILNRSQRLWIGSKTGLIEFDRDRNLFTLHDHKDGDPTTLAHNWVTSVVGGEDGQLWIGTPTGLDLFDLSNMQATHIHNRVEGIDQPNIHVRCLFLDKKNSQLWIGSRFTGVFRLALNQKKFAHYKHNPLAENTLRSGNVTSVIQDRYGIVWIGMFGGLDSFDPQTGAFTHYSHDPRNTNSLAMENVTTLYQSRDGRLWIGTSFGGLDELDLSRRFFKHHSNVGALDVRAVHEDNDGVIWIGTREDPNAGLDSYNTKTGGMFHFPRTGPQNILGITGGRGEYLWICDHAGLFRFEKTSGIFTLLGSDPSDHGGHSVAKATGAHEDRDGFLWVGTTDGLKRIDLSTGKSQHFSVLDGFASDEILGIKEDGNGKLWLRTAKGITRFDSKNYKVRNFDISNFRSDAFEINRRSNEEGVMFFPLGPDGFVAFHPDSIKDDVNIPSVVLTDFKIANKSVVPAVPGSPLKQTITVSKEITLSHSDNMFSFEFAALDYTAPSKNQYAYKMEGFDKEWIQSGNVNTATYTNLDPGRYTFRVKGSNNDGLWNEQGASITVIITPPWWKTMWAYGAYVLLVASILYSIHRVRMNRIHLAHELQLEHLEAEKMHEIDRMKSRFFANISHEFRTPLTLILGPIQKWKRHSERSRTKWSEVKNPEVGLALDSSAVPTQSGLPQNDAAELHRDMSMAERNAHRLLGLINQLLDLSKLEAGAMKLHASRMNIVPLVKGIANSFESSAGMRGIALTVSAEEEEIEVYCDKDMVEKILSNLLSNAFKFTPEGGSVKVEITKPKSQTSKLIELSVSDTGIGIPADHLDKVFDRFYQVDASQTREQEGSGLGLALVKELVELHHGTIQAQSEVGRGTTFTVRLPLGRSHLRDKEIVAAPVSAEPTMHEIEGAIAEKVVEEAREEAESEHAKGEKPIVLVVEDNADVRAYIKDYLVPAYQVAEARDGAEGIEKAQEIIPDLIISDVMMPKKDGYAMCRELKTDEKTSHVPVILLTAKAASGDKIEGLESGADDYLVKPFEPKELVARVKNLIALRRKLRERFSKGVPLKPGEIAVTSMDDTFLQRLMAVVEKRMGDEKFSVEELGHEVGMSRVQIHRKLTALTNHSASEFIRHVRLHRAMDMLMKDAGTVSEIAYSVGFSSPAYFTKCFHEQFGKTPAEIRKSPKGGPTVSGRPENIC